MTLSKVSIRFLILLACMAGSFSDLLVNAEQVSALDSASYYVVSNTVPVASNGYTEVTALCRSGDHVISGGFDVRKAMVDTSLPIGTKGWVVTAVGLSDKDPPRNEPPAIQSSVPPPYVTVAAECSS